MRQVDPANARSMMPQSAFGDALRARLLWIDVVVFERIDGCDDLADAARGAAYDAVHQLASNDVLMYQHYGPRTPLVLMDVEELADQYNLSHELYTELYHKNFHAGSIEHIQEQWKVPAEPLSVPYSQWYVAVIAQLRLLADLPGMQVAEVTSGHGVALLSSWRQGESAIEAAEQAYAAYAAHKEFEQEEAYQRHLEDIADTYMHIEADLWRGWREEHAEEKAVDRE